jgi:hypothetical protein
LCHCLYWLLRRDCKTTNGTAIDVSGGARHDATENN